MLRIVRETAAPGEDAVLVQPMPTHADLAARIGTSREAVSRELGLMAKEECCLRRVANCNTLAGGARTARSKMLR